jgi:CBS domain-containing protein
MRAADVMTTNVITVDPDRSVSDAAKLMLEHRISAVAVVAPGGEPLGILSEGDLMRRTELGTEKHRPWWLAMISDSATMARDYTKACARKVKDVMISPAITVEESTPIEEIVKVLEHNSIKRVPVVHEGRIVGIVSRADLLRILASVSVERSAALADTVIRAQLSKELNRQPWWDGSLVNISVSEGVVELTGFAATEEQRTALRVLAERMSGVRAVRDDMSVRQRVIGYS